VKGADQMTTTVMVVVGEEEVGEEVGWEMEWFIPL
jgi:hypothetical protein